MGKPCVICGKNHERRSTDSATQFKRRQCCSRACSRALIANGKIKYDTPDKVCACCGETFSIRESEKPSAYAQRATCGKHCALTLNYATNAGVTVAEWKAIAHAPRTCTVCGKQYTRKVSEPVRDYGKRQCCSRACVTQAKATRQYRAALTRAANAKKAAKRKAIFRERLDHRPADTPRAPWSPPEAARSPAPPPVPTAKPRAPSRPAQRTLALLRATLAMHPDLATALNTPDLTTQHDRLGMYQRSRR